MSRRPVTPGQYESVLIATEALLRGFGESHFADYLQDDLAAWRESRDVRRHRRRYGGMGTFNDVGLAAANGHNLTPEFEAWARALFAWLKALLFHLSAEPSRHFTEAELRAEVGRESAALMAFVGGAKAADDLRGFSTATVVTSGWRCLACGHVELTPRDIERGVAELVVPPILFHAVGAGTVADAVESVLRQEPTVIREQRDALRAAAASAGVRVVDRDGWMQPCPACESFDIGRFDWNFSPGPPGVLLPSPDNLPLRRDR